MIKSKTLLLPLLGLGSMLATSAGALVDFEDNFDDRTVGSALYGSETSDGQWTWTHGGSLSDSPVIADRDGDLYADMLSQTQTSMSWQKINPDGTSGAHLNADPLNPLEIEFDYLYLTTFSDNAALVLNYLVDDRWRNMLATSQTDPQGYNLRIQVTGSSTLSYRLRHKAGGSWSTVPGSDGSFEVPGMIDPDSATPGVPVRVRFRIEGNHQTLWFDDVLQFDLDIETPHAQNASFSGSYMQLWANSGRRRAFDNLRIREFQAPIVPGDLYWANLSAVRGLALADGTPGTAASDLNRAIGVAIDPMREHVYWAEDAGGRIMRAGLDGSNPEEVLALEVLFNSSAQHLAINPELEKLYWAEFRKGLFMANLDGSSVQQILNIEDLFQTSGSATVTVDQTTGQVYWGSSEDGQIIRMEWDGSSPTSLTYLGGNVYGIAVDPTTQRLYYTNFSGGTLSYLDLDDLTIQDLLFGLGQPLGIAVSADGGTLYWTERMDGKIQTAPVGAGGIGTVETLATGEDSPFGIALLGASTSVPEGFDSWIAAFELPAGENGPAADADGDGVSNLLEYAIGGNPAVSSRDGLPVQAIETIDDSEYLTLTITRNPEATGLTFVLLGSSNLINWEPATDAVTVLDQPDVLKVAIPLSQDPDARSFLRLEVTSQ